MARPLALNEDTLVGQPGAHDLGGVPQAAVAGEQQQRPTVGDPTQLHGALGGGLGERLLGGLRQIDGHVEERLTVVAKGRREDRVAGGVAEAQGPEVEVQIQAADALRERRERHRRDVKRRVP